MLKYRLIFGPIMIAFSVFCIFVDQQVDQFELTGFCKTLFLDRSYPPAGLVLMLVTVGLLIPLAARELSRFFQADGIQSHTLIVSFAAMISCLSVYAIPYKLDGSSSVAIIATVLVSVFILTLLWHSRDANPKGAIAVGGATMFAVVLLGLMPGFYLAMRRWHSAYVVLAVLMTVKSCDIGAYFTGRFLGKHKMIPWLSPKKTWEGLAGGVVLATVVAIGFAYLSQATDLAAIWQTVDGQRQLVPQRYHMGLAAIAGVLFALIGQAGDLTMSLFKRDVGLKDSGTTIPGFGGVLDVFDSPLLVAPVAFWMIELAAKLGNTLDNT